MPKDKTPKKEKEKPPEGRPSKPARPPEDADADAFRLYSIELSVYDTELRAWMQASAPAQLPPAPSVATPKEMKVDVFDGEYAGLARWIFQIEAACLARGYVADLKPDYTAKPVARAAVNHEP